MTIKVRESRLIEVGNKLEEASNLLDVEGTHYNMMKAKLEQAQ